MRKLITVILLSASIFCKGQFNTPASFGFNASHLVVCNTIYLKDNFTGTNGTDLITHTMDVGAGWIQSLSGLCSSANAWSIQSNKANNGTGAFNFFGIDYAEASISDGIVSADLTIPNTGDYFGGLTVRYSDCANWFCVGFTRASSGTPQMIIYQNNAGTRSVVSSVNVASATNSTETVTVTLSGNSIVALCSTGETCNYSTSFNSSATKFGLFGYTDGTYTLPIDVDNFLVTGCQEVEAKAYVTASGITDLNEIMAVSVLAKQEKDSSLWTKHYALYPYLGSTSASCSYNLINPATYQITWNGTSTFDTNGFTPNGSTGYGDTHLNGSVAMTNWDTHQSVFIRDNADNAWVDMGAYNYPNIYAIYSRYGNNVISHGYDVSAGVLTISNSDSRGFYISTGTGTSTHTLYKNGSSIGTDAAAGGSLPNATFYVGAIDNVGFGGAQFFSSRCQIMASLGKGLTTAQAATENLIMQRFKANTRR